MNFNKKIPFALIICTSIIIASMTICSWCRDRIIDKEPSCTVEDQTSTIKEETTTEKQSTTQNDCNTTTKKQIITTTKITYDEESQTIYLGTFKVTAYCPCEKCCGKNGGKFTASGTTPTAGRTIAVDTRVIPFGTEVIIDGHTYIAEDTGGAVKGNKIDIFFNTHQEALNWGLQNKEVSIYK